MRSRSDITFEQAREIARKLAMRDLQKIAELDPSDALSSSHLEAEHCWFFFRNPSLKLPETDWFERAYSVYAVSRRGSARLVNNFSDTPLRQDEYLAVMSAYFAHIELGEPRPTLPDWMQKSK
jgi:hypothetical protein